MDKTSLVYRSGDFFLPKDIVDYLNTYIVGNENSLYYLNYWHINHLLSGVFFAIVHLTLYKFYSPFLTYLLLHTIWEIWQIFIGMTALDLRSFIDILNDTFFGSIGYFIVILLFTKH